MVNVILKNPELVLTPITDNEFETAQSKFMGDENIYVLYKLPSSGNIHIGMMSSSVRKYYPALANVGNLKQATSIAFFQDGGVALEENADSIVDRPVYRIVSDNDRVVVECQILNGTSENGLEVCLDDVVDGVYSVGSNKTDEFQKVNKDRK